MSRPSPAHPRAPQLLSIPMEEGAWLAVAAVGGVAELQRVVVLRGGARALIEALGFDVDARSIARWLEERGTVGEEQALREAEDLAAELRRLDGRSPAQENGPPAADAPPPPDAPVEAWTRLARAVLESGNRLRFQARGRSMRPWLPHGSWLEVEGRPVERVGLGQVVLHSTRSAPLVAHRVVGRRAGGLLTRGDSNARIDTVRNEDYLGVVVAAEHSGRRRAVSSGAPRWLGLGTGLVYRVLIGSTRTLVLRPLRTTFPGRSLVRRGLRGMLRLASGLLLRLERTAARMRRPIDVLRAALYSTSEKDEDRTRLYRRKAIQEFTALEENVRSGLTLLEEVLLARHPIPAGKALVLGCGPGRECLVLARRGLEVTGLDREPGMLERARGLAREAGLSIRYVQGEALDFTLDGPFDVVVIFSGLYNMLLPRERRVRMLQAAHRHLRPGGRVLVTFLCAYLLPGEEPPAGGKPFLESMNPDHQRGDLYLLNEAVHVFPRAEDVRDEAQEAGLETVDLFRDQRAYDRAAGQVRGYAVLRRVE